MQHLVYMRTRVRVGVADGAIDVTSTVVGKLSELAAPSLFVDVKLPGAISDFERHESEDRRLV
jgi:hypothetical protein